MIFKGNVIGHPYVRNDTEITMQDVVSYDYREDAFRTKEDEIVRLGSVHSDYVKMFPGSDTMKPKAFPIYVEK